MGIDLNYPKIGVKLVILVVLGGLLGMGSVRQKRTGYAVARPLFVAVGVLCSRQPPSPSCGGPQPMFSTNGLIASRANWNTFTDGSPSG